MRVVDCTDEEEVEDGTHFQRTPGVVFVYDRGRKNKLDVLTLGPLVEKIYLMGRST